MMRRESRHVVTMTRRVAAEDDFNSYSDYERACTYVSNTNVALAEKDKRRD